MTSPTPEPAVNRLLQALPVQDRANVVDGCVNVELNRSQRLYDSGEAMLHIHFPTSAFVSVVSAIDGRETLRAAMIGNEGAIGYELAFDVERAAHRVLVQGSGMAWRMPAAALQAQLLKSAPLRRVLNRYLCVLLVQSVRIGACHHAHRIEARLARWLLATQDCAQSPQLALTHELLAEMLGVRRSGITNAATALQARALIDYRRGIITITDRGGLEAAACGCYQANRLAYTQLLG